MLGQALGLTDAEFDALQGDSGTSTLFNEKEKAALAWAEAVTRLGDRGVSDEAFEAASAVFNEKQLAELTIAIALMNAYNRMGISFRATPLAVVKYSGQQRSPSRAAS